MEHEAPAVSCRIATCGPASCDPAQFIEESSPYEEAGASGDGVSGRVDGVAVAADGLAIGEHVGAFNVRDITGPNKGKTLCYRCKFGDQTVVTVFTRDVNDSVVSLVKKIDKQVADNKDKKMASFIVVLTNDPDKTEAKLAEVAKKDGITVPLTIMERGRGSKGYGVQKNHETTVMMWVDGTLKVNDGFEKASSTPRPWKRSWARPSRSSSDVTAPFAGGRFEDHATAHRLSAGERVFSFPEKEGGKRSGGRVTLAIWPCRSVAGDDISPQLHSAFPPSQGCTHSVVPSDQFSFFHTGTSSLMRSMSHCPGGERIATVRDRQRTAMLISPSSSRPKRCRVANFVTGHFSRVCCSRSANRASAIPGRPRSRGRACDGRPSSPAPSRGTAPPRRPRDRAPLGEGRVIDRFAGEAGHVESRTVRK